VVSASTFFHWLYSTLGPWPLLFSFMIILQTAGLLGRVISSSQGLYLNTGHHKHRINTYTHQTSMPCVGYEPTIPASEGAKTVHALDSAATVTGHLQLYYRTKMTAFPSLSVFLMLIVLNSNFCHIFLCLSQKPHHTHGYRTLPLD
jgi:hypothetical protein